MTDPAPPRPRRKPVVFELDDTAPAPPGPDQAPQPPDDDLPPLQGHAMRAAAAQMTAPGRSRWARLVWAALAGFVALAVSVTAWDFATDLMARSPVLGWLGLGLLGVLALAALGAALRELAGLARLRRLDRLQHDAAAAIAANDLAAARAVTDALAALYTDRQELRWQRQRLQEARGDIFDADSALGLAETTLLTPLDGLATREVESATRQVALLTAAVPMALADVAVALAVNLRMIRRIATIYGGRAGALGSMRLLRSVFAHILATGAISAGDDLLGSVAGGGLMSRVSRRFGEGVVNGALTARVGVAAMTVCRPLPFRAASRPGVSATLRRALTGLFARD